MTANTRYAPMTNIAPRRALGHCGCSSNAVAGIRQFSRSAREISGTLGARRAVHAIQPPIATTSAPKTMASSLRRAVASTDGITVEMTRIIDSMIKTATIRVATMFNHGLLTHGPSTVRSLHKRTRNTVALGKAARPSPSPVGVRGQGGAWGTTPLAAATATIAVNEP